MFIGGCVCGTDGSRKAPCEFVCVEVLRPSQPNGVSISTKECCRPRRGLNPRPPGTVVHSRANKQMRILTVSSEKVPANVQIRRLSDSPAHA